MSSMLTIRSLLQNSAIDLQYTNETMKKKNITDDGKTICIQNRNFSILWPGLPILPSHHSDRGGLQQSVPSSLCCYAVCCCASELLDFFPGHSTTKSGQQNLLYLSTKTTNIVFCLWRDSRTGKSLLL